MKRIVTIGFSRLVVLGLVLGAGSGCEPSAGEESVAAASGNVFCGYRWRKVKVDPYNEGAANYVITDVADKSVCWTVDRFEDGRVSVFERIASPEGLPDGYCTLEGMAISKFQAEVTGGRCRFYQETAQGPVQARIDITEGEMRLGGPDELVSTVSLEGTYLIGDQRMRARAGMGYDGDRTASPKSEPGVLGDNTISEPVCQLAGCWSGTVTAVHASPECPEEGHTDPEGRTLGFTVAEDYSEVVAEGVDHLLAAPDFERCAVVTNWGSVFVGQWRITFERDGAGPMTVSMHRVSEADPCDRTLTGVFEPCVE